MVLPPQTIPNHIEPIEASKIKYKTFSTDSIGWGGGGFNKTPLVPPGTKVIIHEKMVKQKSWDPHRVEEWYKSGEPIIVTFEKMGDPQ